MAQPTAATTDAPVQPDDVAPPERTEPAAASDADRLVEADLLVEDVSIDGMCGVY